MKKGSALWSLMTLCIFSFQVLKSQNTMTVAGSGTVDVETASLSSGVYNYSLIIDGKTIETKRLTVAR